MLALMKYSNSLKGPVPHAITTRPSSQMQRVSLHCIFRIIAYFNTLKYRRVKLLASNSEALKDAALVMSQDATDD